MIEYFGARRYLAQLLQSTPMESLLGKHMEMSTEIKTLDSDMQVKPSPSSQVPVWNTLSCTKHHTTISMSCK